MFRKRLQHNGFGESLHHVYLRVDVLHGLVVPCQVAVCGFCPGGKWTELAAGRLASILPSRAFSESHRPHHEPPRPIDHVAKYSPVEFLAPHLRVVAVNRDRVIDDPWDGAIRDDDWVPHRGPNPIAVVDPHLKTAEVVSDKGSGVVHGPNPDRDVTRPGGNRRES